MDFGMPYAQKQAWNNVKEAIDSYVEVTGSDIAVVTKFSEASQYPGGGGDPLSTKTSLALHGHGNLLLQVKQYLEQIQNQMNVQGGRENGAPTRITIPTPRKNVNYHNQSIARSLTSSFQSLKLDGGCGWKSRTENPKKEKLPRRNQSANPRNRDLAELNENLLFEEESPDEERDDFSDSDIDDEDDDDFDSDDYTDLRRDNTIIRPRVNNFPPDPSKSGTSLPVNINMNYMTKPEVRPHFSQMKYQNIPTRHENLVDDTPNPSKMMASIQALARSVTEDSTQIFGDRPRPNVISQKFT